VALSGRISGKPEPVGSPAGELREHRPRRLEGLGELVPLRSSLPDLSHDSLLLERSQPRRKDVCADTPRRVCSSEWWRGPNSSSRTINSAQRSPTALSAELTGQNE
jgi:hypothetical protein